MEPKGKPGRRPIADKKVQINLMVKGSELKRLGGRERLQQLIYKLLKQAYNFQVD